MKKLTALLIALIMALSLVACGGEEPTKKPGNPPDAADNDSINTDSSNVAEKNEPQEEIPSFEEIAVVDNEECAVKITGIEPDNMWGYTLKAYLENKSADKTYMFSVSSAAINGVQVDPFFASEVASGKKSNENVQFLSEVLKANGIEDYTDIELSFRVYDSEDWMADAVAQETVHIYPKGEDKAELFTRESQSTDVVMLDSNNVTVIATGYEEDSIWGYTVNLYIVNKTDKELMFSVDSASVNGFMADPFWAETVSAGKMAFSSMSWSDSEFEDNGITAVEEIELQLRVYDYNDWMADDIANESVTLKP